MLTQDEGTEKDEQRGGSSAAIPKADHLFLVVECARPLVGGLRCDLSRVFSVELGRGSERAATRESDVAGQRLIVRVPDRRMSATHARLVRTDRGFVLEDTGSTNGTTLDGEPIAGPSPVKDGSFIEVGRTVFRFREQLRASTDPDLDLDIEKTAPPGALSWTTLNPAVGAELDLLDRLARSNMPILLLGETGTGKEVLARLIHSVSGRSGGMVAVNCGAIPRELLASALFGHRRGAFSGATEDAPGFFRSADRGTLLLDEIGDLPLESQVTLLRVLQEQEVVPVGSTRPIPVDVRVLAATHASLAELVAQGGFRADLLNRLSGHTHHLAPLRERREDMGVLIAGIAAQWPEAGSMELTLPACRALLRYPFPGNVRELRQVLKRAVVLSEGRAITLTHLPPAVAECADLEVERPDAGIGVDPVSEEEQALRKQLEAALVEHGGNVSRVAAALGKHRMQIQRWMKRFGLRADRFR